MRNMSFAHTVESCRGYLKNVTRRNGWPDLKVGEVVQQVVKGMGLKLGEKVENIHQIQIVGNRPEPLNMLLKLPEYGEREMIREGFPGRDPADFVTWYCEHNKKQPGDMVNRIDFRYYLDPATGAVINVPASIAVCPSCKTGLTIAPDGWYLDTDGTMVCDSFTHWCEQEPDIQERRAYRQFEESHAQEMNMPYVYWLPVDDEIEIWLKGTFRFAI